MTTQETYRRYADLKAQIKDLSTELAELSTVIVDDITAQGGETVVTQIGSFYTTSRKLYDYSPHVEAMEDALQVAQEIERKDGTAVVVKETTSLTFRPLKV